MRINYLQLIKKKRWSPTPPRGLKRGFVTKKEVSVGAKGDTPLAKSNEGSFKGKYRASQPRKISSELGPSYRIGKWMGIDVEEPRAKTAEKTSGVPQGLPTNTSKKEIIAKNPRRTRPPPPPLVTGDDGTGAQEKSGRKSELK